MQKKKKLKIHAKKKKTYSMRKKKLKIHAKKKNISKSMQKNSKSMQKTQNLCKKKKSKTMQKIIPDILIIPAINMKNLSEN